MVKLKRKKYLLHRRKRSLLIKTGKYRGCSYFTCDDKDTSDVLKEIARSIGESIVKDIKSRFNLDFEIEKTVIGDNKGSFDPLMRIVVTYLKIIK